MRFAGVSMTLAAALAMRGVLGCCDDDNDSERICEPGSTQLCHAPGACEGAQQCLSDGSGWGDCVCGEGSGGAGGADVGSAGEGGAGGSDQSAPRLTVTGNADSHSLDYQSPPNPTVTFWINDRSDGTGPPEYYAWILAVGNATPVDQVEIPEGTFYLELEISIDLSDVGAEALQAGTYSVGSDNGFAAGGVGGACLENVSFTVEEIDTTALTITFSFTANVFAWTDAALSGQCSTSATGSISGHYSGPYEVQMDW